MRHPRPRRDGRRDAAIAACLGLAVVALLIAARADSRGDGPRGDHRPSPPQARPAAWAAPLPPGWHEVDRRLTGVLVPVQIFAAATYPIVLHHRPGQCGPPQSVLAEMPPDGALLQVIEYPSRVDGHPLRVPRLPRRPDRFNWADATWAPFECAGPSFQFTYRQSGRALQAQVWMNPATVAPRLRAGALRILDNLRPHTQRTRF
jgi:hypothetical protein